MVPITEKTISGWSVSHFNDSLPGEFLLACFLLYIVKLYALFAIRITI